MQQNTSLNVCANCWETERSCTRDQKACSAERNQFPSQGSCAICHSRTSIPALWLSSQGQCAGTKAGGGTPRTQGQCAGTQGTGGAHPEHRDSVLAHRGRGTLRTQGKCAGTHGEGHTQNTGTVCWYTGGGAHSEHKDSVLAHRGSTPVHRDSVVAHRGRDTSRTQGEDTPRTLGEDTPRKQGQCD